MSCVITDGPYGGQSCNSEEHIYHENLNDSVFRQEYLQNQFYVNLKNKNVYIYQPDNFFYYGGSKAGMGYNENQYSLPRWQDLTISRMGMYDDTYFHTNTEGWMFLPLTPYHSNNPDCIWEPLSEHLFEYDWALGQYLGYGVMANLRGTRLYDTNDTRSVVVKWVNFYKKHRDILISDIIHLRRCDMQYFDAILHVNSLIDEKGLAMFFNPTNYNINVNYTFSLYYTGIKNNVYVSLNDSQYISYKLTNLYDITIELDIPKKTLQYYVFKETL